MYTKNFIGFIGLTILGLICSQEMDFVRAALRRVPKVYNALITTDENLTPSRAFPVIQPTIQETGIAHFPLSPFHPYSYVNPVVRLVPPPVALPPPQQAKIPQFLPQLIPQAYPGSVQPPPTAPAEMKPKEMQSPPTAPAKEQAPTTEEPSTPMATVPMQTKKPNAETAKALYMPIPLNQYGLPPSLIPLRQLPPPSPPQLPPFAFRPYPPIIYNPITGFRAPFLPPFDYLPTGPHYPLSNVIPGAELPTSPAMPQTPTTTTTTAADETKPPQTPPKKRTATPPLRSTMPKTLPTTPTTLTTMADTTAPESTFEDTELTDEPTTEAFTQLNFESIKNGSKGNDASVPDVPPPPLPTKIKSR